MIIELIAILTMSIFFNDWIGLMMMMKELIQNKTFIERKKGWSSKIQNEMKNSQTNKPENEK